MSSLKEFIDYIQSLSNKALPASDVTLSGIQSALAITIGNALVPISNSLDEREEFTQKVSSLVENDEFLSELSNQIGEPLENESEDEFVQRSSENLRQILYARFGVNL